jgi:ABC-2 type transport system permease protein/sodium transport system permease protein
VPDSLAASSNDRLSRLVRLTLKELREILRDRRTIITLVLMPLLMYPLMSVAFQQFFISHIGTTRAPHYVLGFVNEAEGAYFEHLLSEGGLALGETPHSAGGELKPVVEAGIMQALEAGLAEYEIDVGLRLLDVGHTDLHEDPRRDLAIDVEVLYVPASTASRDAAAYIEKSLAAASTKFLEARLARLGVTQRAVPLRTVRRAVADADSTSSFGAVSITAVVPFILILMTVTGAVYPAIDLTAGERERGTLEVLIAAPIPRIGVLLAKYVTVLLVAVLTAAANLVTMTITISVSGLSRQLFGEAGISAGVIAAVFGLLLLFAAFFSAVLLVITSSARSFKEAQAYLIPLMLISLAPGMLALMPDVELSGLLLVTPLANIVLLGRDMFALKASGMATAIVVSSTLLYAAAAIALAARIFGAESVLYSTQSGWSDLFRRPREPQPTPTVTSAFACLALMFPAYFLFFNLLGRASDNIVAQLALGVGMTAIVFGGIPLAVCRARRVPIAPAFRLPASAPAVFLAVALVGLSFWTLSHEMVLVLKQWRDVTLDPRLVTAVNEYIAKLRTLPVPVVVLCMALVPAFFEEAFFRGYLFAALASRTTAAATIVATAIAFGLFHVINPSQLASERLASTTLVGLVLGFVRWRTGSLLPGIVLHTLHNGLVILLAYCEPELTLAHIGISETEHLPAGWIAAGAAGVCAGLILLIAVTRRKE